jgi:hypothetical protein
MLFTILFVLLSIVVILIVKFDEKFNKIIFRQFASERIIKKDYISDNCLFYIKFTYFTLPKILFGIQAYLLLKIIIEQNSPYLMFLFSVLMVLEYFGYQKIKQNKQKLNEIFERHKTYSISLSFEQYKKYYRIVKVIYKENCILNLYYWVLKFGQSDITVIINSNTYLKLEFFGKEIKFIFFNPEIVGVGNIIEIKSFYSFKDALEYLRGVNV